MVLALALAALVNIGLPAQWLWRLSFFSPYLLASTVVVLFFAWMYNPELGLFNDLLAKFGHSRRWRGCRTRSVAMWAVVITTVWWTIGFNFLLYLAALQNIPQQHFEAAALDGAGGGASSSRSRSRSSAPTTALIVILQILASLKVFDQIYMLTKADRAERPAPIVQYIYESGFTGYRLGYSPAISYLFFALVLLVALAQYKLTNGKGVPSHELPPHLSKPALGPRAPTADVHKPAGEDAALPCPWPLLSCSRSWP